MKVEFIESYIKTNDGDYIWNDNHGELVRCKDCKHSLKREYDWICAHPHNNAWNITAEHYCGYGERKEQDE